MSKIKVHIVTYTHWDREFRWEFERTRMRLVDCIDHLLEIMRGDPDYASFMLDGQMTLVDDYLDIRPEKSAEIAELVKSGRLEIGPWYSLPDCAPISGESVVRNLAYGIKRAAEFGSAMMCGYNVFSFGQIAQLPQIYSNFGIDTIIFYKHLDASRTKYHEFIWESPDGIRALASRLGKEARWNFFFAGHIPIVYGLDPWHKDWRYRWGELGKIFHTADPEDYGWFYDILDPETSFHPEKLRDGMERALKTLEGTAAPECVLLFDGTDFTEPHPLTSEYLKAIRKQYGDDIEIVHSSLSAYLNELKATLSKRDDLDVITGAMRDGPVGAVNSDVMSIHPELQIENSHVENSLLRWAEPYSTIAWLHDIERYPDTYIEKTWKLLFQCHAHDSLHGLGPVTLAEGEMARLKQAGVIAMGLERRALQNITKEIDTSSVSDTEFFMAVHNPTSFVRSEVVEAFLDIPAEVNIDYVVIEDSEGNAVQTQEVERKETRAGIYHPRSRNMPFYCTRAHLYFMAENVPAMGYKVFKIKWKAKDEYPYPHEHWDTPRLLANNMMTGPTQAENEFLRVNVNNDGTIEVTDKLTGKSYASLNYFLDQGDAGNMWMSAPPGNDMIINSLGASADIAVVINGPLAVVFRIDLALELPAELDYTSKKRASAKKTLPIKVQVTLRKNAPYLEVVTTLENTVRDHYLKVCFPSGVEAECTYAEGAFTVTSYPVKPSVDGELRGKELARHPAQLWFDIYDGTNGLAVLSDAAKDYEILENDQNMTMAMGLVRCVPLRIPCDNRLWMDYPGDESSQSLRELSFRYALMPHAKSWEKAGLYNAALAFNTPMRACQFGKQEGRLPIEKGFLSLEGEGLVLSAVKKAEERDSVIVRFFNPTEENREAVLNLGFDITEAYLVTLPEERLDRLAVKDGAVSVPAGKGKIISVELVI